MPNSTQNKKLKYTSLFILLFLSFLFSTKIQSQTIYGKIVDELNIPVPYATIFVSETREGTISNSEGNYNLNLPQGNYHITVRSLGHVQIEQVIQLNTDSLMLNIILPQQEYKIKEVKVFPGKEDPAYYIIRRAMANAAYYREKIKHYEAGLYIKSNFTFTNIPKFYQKRIEVNGKQLKDAFKEDVTYVVESQNKITFDYPDSYKQEVISKKTSLTGFDEPPVMGLMTSTFYEERPSGVISPLAATALNHYDYRYDGFITVGKFDIFKIKVIPKRRSDELVAGTIYIVDKLWCIYNVDFTANIKFFHFHIKQQYENLGNENWMPVSHIMNGDFSLLGLKGEFYYGATLKYDAIEENDLIPNPNKKETPQEKQPEKKTNEKETALRKEVAEIAQKEELNDRDVKKVARLNRKILKEQYQDSTFAEVAASNYKIKEAKDSLVRDTFKWDSIRAIPLTPAEIKSYELSDSLQTMEKQTPDSTNTNSAKKSMFKKIVTGHFDFCKDSLIRFGYSGLISTENADFNAVDGYKYKQAFQFKADLDSAKYIAIYPEIGYAFNRKAIFWSVKSRFNNLLLDKNRVEVLFGKESRDFKFENNGIHHDINSISSWFFGENYMRLYETGFFRLKFLQEISKNLGLKTMVDYNHFSPLENNATYRLSKNKDYHPNIPKGLEADSPYLKEQKSFFYEIGLNYKKRQRKPWLENSAFLMISDFYEISLAYRQGVKNILNSESDFNRIDFNFHQQANVSPTAGIDWKISAGYFPIANQLHFSQFSHFNTSEIVVPFSDFTHTFQLINDYEFSTNDKYINAGFEYKTEYLLARYISIFNKNSWSESLHLNYLCTPNFQNYWEAGYSLNNLFFLGNFGLFTGFNENHFESFSVKFSISGF